MTTRSQSYTSDGFETHPTTFSQTSKGRGRLPGSGISGVSSISSNLIPHEYDPDFLYEQVQLLRSLDDIEREDLSKQLTLTWHLNKAFKDFENDQHLGNSSELRGSGQGESRASIVAGSSTKDSHTNNDEKPVSVPTYRPRWRAWPLPSHQAPRLEPKRSSSDSLRDCLAALILRQASHQIKKREEDIPLSADDDESAATCKPSVDQIMGALDRLLGSLYKSREGYAADSQLQNRELMFRKRRLAASEDEELESDANDDDDHDADVDSREESASNRQKRQKTSGGPSIRSVNQAYRQGAQTLLDESDVFKHSLVQSFPRGVLHRASERLDKIFQAPADKPSSRDQCITLLESRDDYIEFGTLEEPAADSSNMASLGRIFLETDAERLAVGERLVNRSMWQTWADHKKQQRESGCFDRDGFLDEIPGHRRTKQSRQREYQVKKRRELDTEYG